MLAASLRQTVEHAVRARAVDAASLDGRFLRRLVGALSAYETAQEILDAPEQFPQPPPVPGRGLATQRCPACGSQEFTAVSAGWVVHLVCRRCNSCARAGRHGLVPTKRESCPGCDFAERCTNRADNPFGGT